MHPRYLQLLKNLLRQRARPAATPGPDGSPADAFEISLADPWTERILGGVPAPLPPHVGVPRTVIDRHQHQRPAYRGLFVYALRQADPSLDVSAWMKLLSGSLEAAGGQFPSQASHGAEATRLAWDALALGALTDWSRSAPLFARLVAQQQSSGQFLATTASDNPETHWFHELVLLHAAGAFASHAQDAAARQASFRAAEYHQAETQPDHATTQPWALLAMIQNPQTHPLADQLLHSVATQHPGGIGGVSSLLLTDTLACLLREAGDPATPAPRQGYA